MVNSGATDHSSARVRPSVTFNVDILHIPLLVSKNLFKFRENNICFKPGRKIWAASTQFNSDGALIFFHMYTNLSRCRHFRLNVLFYAERDDKVSICLLYGWPLTFFSPPIVVQEKKTQPERSFPSVPSWTGSLSEHWTEPELVSTGPAGALAVLPCFLWPLELTHSPASSDALVRWAGRWWISEQTAGGPEAAPARDANKLFINFFILKVQQKNASQTR